MNICLIFNERPVLNQLRLVRTSNQSRPVLIGFLWSLINPVRFFEVLGLWWTGLSLGLSPWRSKTETRPDFQSLASPVIIVILVALWRRATAIQQQRPSPELCLSSWLHPSIPPSHLVIWWKMMPYSRSHVQVSEPQAQWAGLPASCCLGCTA